jgi:hypothetical protein
MRGFTALTVHTADCRLVVQPHPRAANSAPTVPANSVVSTSTVRRAPNGGAPRPRYGFRRPWPTFERKA